MNYITINENKIERRHYELGRKPYLDRTISDKASHPGGLALGTLTMIRQTLERIPFANAPAFFEAAYGVKARFDAKIQKLGFFSKIFACWKIFQVECAFEDVLERGHPSNYLRLATQTGSLEDMKKVYNNHPAQWASRWFVWPALTAAIKLGNIEKIKWLVETGSAQGLLSQEQLSMARNSRNAKCIVYVFDNMCPSERSELRSDVILYIKILKDSPLEE